jgi:hypothetical protein
VKWSNASSSPAIEWMARQSELRADLRGADDQAIRGLRAGEKPQFRTGRPGGGNLTPAIPLESTSIGPGLFGPERALEIVLHPALFFERSDGRAKSP